MASLSISFSGVTSDLNETRIYADGKLVDAPASSVSGTVNTLAGGDLRLGSLRDGTPKMAGFLDEIRVSSVARGHAWAKHSLKTSEPVLILSITTCNI